MTKKQDNSTFENKADQDALADIEARKARGEDVFGDGDEPQKVEAAAEEPEEEKAPEKEAKEEPKEEATEEAAAEEKAEGEKEEAKAGATEEKREAEEPEVQEFKTISKAELTDQRQALRQEKNEAFKKYAAGKITEDEYLSIENRVDDSLIELAAQRALLEANEQTRLTAQQAKLTQIRADAKKSGLIDYEDEAAAKEFDAALQFAAALKSNAGLGFNALADKAHELVLVQRGIKKPEPEAAKVERKAPQAPITLSRLPAAATPNSGGGVAEQLSRLDGLDFQEAIGRMSKAQRDAWLDS